MKKIILAVDALNFQPEALDLPAYITGLSRSKLTGIFMEDITPELALRMNNPDAFSFMTQSEEEMLLHREDDKRIKESKERFRQECEKRGITGKIFSEKGIPSEMIVRQSRYADLLVATIITAFSSLSDNVPPRFIRRILAQAECPVIIAPERFNGIEELVFASDGSASSVFAIRQFTYQFPELAAKKATVVHSTESGEPDEENQKLLMEWMQLHYEDVYFRTESGSLLDTFLGAYRHQTAMIGIMGAYGRTALSRFFKESSADDVLKLISIPLFITHH